MQLDCDKVKTMKQESKKKLKEFVSLKNLYQTCKRNQDDKNNIKPLPQILSSFS